VSLDGVTTDVTNLRSVKMITPSKELAREHYSDLSERPFYGSLVDYITSGVPVVAL
jgi:nucleoside-diphosphate kinase